MGSARVAAPETVELRCSQGPGRLFAKMKMTGEKPRFVDDGMLVEVSCRDCTKTARAQDPSVLRVLHRFSILGELVSSERVREENGA